jgi:hypothetical protein
MEFLTKFVDVYKGKPYFASVFITSLTHDSQTLSAELDETLSIFLNKAFDSSAFNNTIVFFYGDHGLRYSSTRSTDIGTHEVQSPVFFVATPKWFSNKYKTIHDNLKRNTRKLTTLYDLHETLRNILNFNGENIPTYSVRQRGESLFSKMSDTRNCSDVGVPDSMCSCSHYKKVKNIPLIYRKFNISDIVVKKLNDLLKNHKSICERLTLNKTIVVHEDTSKKRLQAFKITIRTSPGAALFEAPVFIDSTTNEHRVGQILRINRYGDQSKCVNDYFLRNYCFCKKQKS